MGKVTVLETGVPALAFDPVPKSLDSGGSDFADGRMAPRAFGPRGPDYSLEALRGGILCSFLEPLICSWSHFVGIYCQKLTTSLKK